MCLIFESIAAGATPGEVVRTLNARGLSTKRGGPFSTRRLRELARCRVYVGEKGYPPIIDADLFDRVQAILDQRSLTMPRRGLGGPEPHRAFMLRGIASCDRCGDPLYVRSYGTSRYVCGHARVADGMCSAPPIRADVLEDAVLRVLDRFVGDLDVWVAERIQTRQTAREDAQANAGRAVAHVATLERRADRAQAVYNRLLDADDPLADEALAQLGRIRGDLDAARVAVGDAQAVVEEMTNDVDVNAVANWLADLRAVIDGRLKASDTAEEMAVALRSHVADSRAVVLEPEPENDIHEPHVQVEVSARVEDEPIPRTAMAVPADQPHDSPGWFLAWNVGGIDGLGIGFYPKRPGDRPSSNADFVIALPTIVVPAVPVAPGGHLSRPADRRSD